MVADMEVLLAMHYEHFVVEPGGLCVISGIPVGLKNADI